jgi:glucosamine-6-phosphate deaminase
VIDLFIFPSSGEANEAAAQRLSEWLAQPATRNIMVAAGNTPLDLYRRVADRRLSLSHLHVFALDEYVGVPIDELRNCSNLLRRSVAEAWRIPPRQFHTVSSLESDAQASVEAHERRIADHGGLDVTLLGLGQNGHLGFNEPGSAADSVGRLLDLEPSSVEANRKWFAGDFAPSKGVTVGLKTILNSHRILIMAYGTHKTTAVKAMVEAPVNAQCPASFLQQHPAVYAYLDEAAASDLDRSI